MDSRSELPVYFIIPEHSRPIGYSSLVLRHRLATLPHHRWSFLADKGSAKQLDHGRHVLRLADYDPDEMTTVDHLLFSLKHDGVSLPIITEVFASSDRKALERELASAVRSTPTGQYHRRLWYLYEWFTHRRLPIGDLASLNFVPLLDADTYHVASGRKVVRQRVIDNLPGNPAFCPLVRRSDELNRRSTSAIRDKLDALVSAFEPEVLSRALRFIYTKETRSSFEIEHERPTAKREERFAAILAKLDDIPTITEATLTQLQNRIVDPRFADDGFRTSQNYVGESVGLHRQIVHYVSPKPADVPRLMAGLLDAIANADQQTLDPIVCAAAIAFGFVFIHPFEDGNGRLHRLLIHYILARRSVTPEGVIAPVSAVMLARRAEYDRVLETFSRPLLELLDYELDDNGYCVVRGDTERLYRYFDATPMAEALYRWLDEAIDDQLRGELVFLVGLRKAKAAMAEIVDLPDRQADLFVKLVVGNGGRLAKRKRDHFRKLTDAEIAKLEKAVRSHLVTS